MGHGSNLNNVEQNIRNNSKYCFVKNDINNISSSNMVKDIDVIINVAAETHVDRSICYPTDFIHSNYNGTFALLEYARHNEVKRFIQISTDEVYGEADGEYSFKEDDILKPSNPYSSTKAASDLLVNAYFRTYGLHTCITRCTNNFGPNQIPEKLIPNTILRIMLGLAILIYGSGKQIRDWIYVLDHVKALDRVIRNGRPGHIYNISASNPVMNIDLVRRVSSLVKAINGKSVPIKFVQDRPGHDYRYSLDSTKISTELGWTPESNFKDSLEDTVHWYLDNRQWWQNLINPYVIGTNEWQNDS